MRRHLLTLLLLIASFPMFAARPAATKFSVASRHLSEQRSVLVSLPKGYEKAGERYPVLYMTDGDVHLDHTAAALDAIADVLRMPPIIIVAIPHADRTKDLTPTHVAEDFREGAMRNYPTSGGGRKFGAFIVDELIPAIDGSFRTVPCRLFAGYSFGGLLGLDMMFDRPALFSAWIIVSPDTHWDHEYILERARKFAEGTAPAPTTVVLMRGDEGDEMARGVERLTVVLESLRARGLDAHVTVFPDDDHLTVPVPAFYAGVRHFFRPWFFRILDDDDPDTLYARALKHHGDLSARYGFSVEMPENRFSRIGGVLLRTGRVEQAIAVFAENVRRRPGSPDAHASLGGAYEAGGQVTKALRELRERGPPGEAAPPEGRRRFPEASRRAREEDEAVSLRAGSPTRTSPPRASSSRSCGGDRKLALHALIRIPREHARRSIEYVRQPHVVHAVFDQVRRAASM